MPPGKETETYRAPNVLTLLASPLTLSQTALSRGGDDLRNAARQSFAVRRRLTCSHCAYFVLTIRNGPRPVQADTDCDSLPRRFADLAMKRAIPTMSTPETAMRSGARPSPGKKCAIDQGT